MNLDLLLVHPPTRKRVYQKLSMDLAAHEPPYLAALTAEFARNHGYEVRILDADAENLDLEEITEGVTEYNPRLIQIIAHGQQPSASTQMMSGIEDLCISIKEENPDYKILLTGNHPSALPRRTLNELNIDFVGRGEAFNTVLGILQGQDFSKIPGLFYRDGDEVFFKTPEKNFTNDELNEFLKTGAWDLLPMEKYRAHNWHCFDDIENRQPYASIYTSFGCGMGCEFCMIDDIFTVGGTQKSRIRFRDPKIIVDEIESLVTNYGVRNIKFIDEMFVFNRPHYTAITEDLIERGLGNVLNIWAYARIDTVHEGKLELLRNAGISWLGLGIESGNNEVRRESAKGKFDDEKIKKIVSQIQDNGINAACNYIFGLKGDTLESMQQTIDLAGELNGEWANFYCAMAYPGSSLHRQVEMGKYALPSDWKENRPILPEYSSDGWIGYSQHAFETLPLPTSTLYPEEVLEFRDKSFINYFTDERYLKMINDKFGERTEQRIKDMTSLPKLKRKLLGHSL